MLSKYQSYPHHRRSSRKGWPVFTSWQVSRVVSAEKKADQSSRIIVDRRPNVVAGQRGAWFAHGEIPRLLGKEGISRAVEGPGRAS